MTQIFKWLNSVLLKTLQKKLELLLLSMVAIFESIVLVFENHLLALLPPNKELMAIRTIEVSLLLVLLLVASYVWFYIKYVSKSPNMSKKTDIQESILNILNKESYNNCFLGSIAKSIGEYEQKTRYNLEILEDHGLVSDNSMMSPCPWYLTKNGRKYLYGRKKT